MNLAKMIFIFYRRLILPILIFAMITGLFSDFLSDAHLLSTMGIAYIFYTPLVVYFVYEIKYPEEYFFYFNLGLSKLQLWGCSAGISIFIGLLMIIL